MTIGLLGLLDILATSAALGWLLRPSQTFSNETLANVFIGSCAFLLSLLWCLYRESRAMHAQGLSFPSKTARPALILPFMLLLITLLVAIAQVKPDWELANSMSLMGMRPYDFATGALLALMESRALLFVAALAHFMLSTIFVVAWHYVQHDSVIQQQHAGGTGTKDVLLLIMLVLNGLLGLPMVVLAFLAWALNIWAVRKRIRLQWIIIFQIAFRVLTLLPVAIHIGRAVEFVRRIP